MSKLKAVKWKQLVDGLRKFGFEGPYQGGRHPFMVKNNLVLTIPNPHKKPVGVDLLKRILKQADIDRDKWINR